MLPNSPTAFFAIVFVAGAILFVIGTMLKRERQARALDAAHVPVEAPRPEQAVDVETRIDLVERLAIVGQPWCVMQLNEIRDNDADESVRDAAEAALIVIGARPSTGSG